jgi:hypothetical protein
MATSASMDAGHQHEQIAALRAEIFALLGTVD